jgi:predicted nucleotide-binding protein
MGRKQIQAEPLTNAEKQARYRAKNNYVKDQLELLKAPLPVLNPDAMREAMLSSAKQELQEKWETELKTERMAAERKQGRENAKRADKNWKYGKITGICDTADFFIGKNMVDIAQNILTHFCIDRETVVVALQVDKRTKSMTLESLDKSGAWGYVKGLTLFNFLM